MNSEQILKMISDHITDNRELRIDVQCGEDVATISDQKICYETIKDIYNNIEEVEKARAEYETRREI